MALTNAASRLPHVTQCDQRARVSKSAVVSPSGWPRAGLDWASRSWHVQDVLAAPAAGGQ